MARGRRRPAVAHVITTCTLPVCSFLFDTPSDAGAACREAFSRASVNFLTATPGDTASTATFCFSSAAAAPSQGHKKARRRDGGCEDCRRAKDPFEPRRRRGLSFSTERAFRRAAKWLLLLPAKWLLLLPAKWLLLLPGAPFRLAPTRVRASLPHTAFTTAVPVAFSPKHRASRLRQIPRLAALLLIVNVLRARRIDAGCRLRLQSGSISFTKFLIHVHIYTWP